MILFASKNRPLLNHQIKKCNGICDGRKEIEIYNRRAKNILTDFTYENPNFIMIDKGRTVEEKSLILIENGCYAGYGYFDSSQQISSPEEFRNFIKRADYYPDANDLVRSFLKKGNEGEKIVLSERNLLE